MEYCNFLFPLPGGIKILFWGNPVVLPEQRNAILKEAPDILILQITDSRTHAIAAKLCTQMNCKVVIPHPTDFPKDYRPIADALEEELAKHAPQTRYILPPYAQWISL